MSREEIVAHIDLSYCCSVVLSPEFEEVVKTYAESVHDQWSYAKVRA